MEYITIQQPRQGGHGDMGEWLGDESASERATDPFCRRMRRVASSSLMIRKCGLRLELVFP